MTRRSRCIIAQRNLLRSTALLFYTLLQPKFCSIGNKEVTEIMYNTVNTNFKY